MDPLLAHHLEVAYHEIKPFENSYGDELRSALEIGPEGELKLKHILPEIGVDVIFQSHDSARVYARNLPARLSKSFLTSFIRDRAQSGGGSERAVQKQKPEKLAKLSIALIYRGYDALLRYLEGSSKTSKTKMKTREQGGTLKAKTTTRHGTSETGQSDNNWNPPTKTDNPPMQSATAGKPSSRLANLFSMGYSASSASRTNADLQDPAEQGDDNTTAEAMEEGGNDGNAEPELAELILVIHGVGQKVNCSMTLMPTSNLTRYQLATTYDSFNIVYAINQLRKLSNQQARDPAVSQIIGSKRVQFIPLQWRTSLQFDETMEDDEDEETHLDNRFSLDDIQVQGCE